MIMSRTIGLFPLLITLGCASSATPPASAPAVTVDSEQPRMVAVYGVLPDETRAPEEASPPPPPPSPPPPPPVVAYTLAVRDLIDPAATPKLDGVAGEVRQGQWAKAGVLLGKLLPEIDEKGPIHEKLAAHALAGRIAAQTKNAKKADAEYEAVLALAKDSSVISSAIDALGGDEAEKRHRYQTAAFALGEAQFHFAEKKRKEADDVAVPKYQGSGAKDEVLAFINKQLVKWIQAKRVKIDEAEKQYAKILQHQPAPHPRWVVASAARVGQMWSRFVDDFRNAPMPKEWMGDGVVPGTELSYAELRTEYRRKLEEASEPQFQAATNAFKSCADHAAKFNIVNDDSKSCQAWLAAHPTK